MTRWTKAQLNAHQKGEPIPAKTNDLTQAIEDYLNLNGYKAWRQNNVAVYDTKAQRHRAFVGKKGLSDIIGWRKKTAVWIAVEVKAGDDKPTADQIAFLQSVREDGGIGIFAETFDQFLTELNQQKQ